MKEEYHKWRAQYLDRDFELLVFGHDGLPVILFPPAKARFYEAKDNGLIAAAAEQIESGQIKIYCPDTADADSWFDFNIHPAERARRYLGYENVILYDILNFARHETGREKACLAGCGFGAYHAANFAFKHPDLICSIISMGGTFDIKPYIFGYYDDNCYFNNPPDYLPGLNDPWYIEKFREMDIFFGTGEFDDDLRENKNISSVLSQKNIDHRLDIKGNADNGWYRWKQMFPEYLSRILQTPAHLH